MSHPFDGDPDFGYDVEAFEVQVNSIERRLSSALVGRWSHCALFVRQSSVSPAPIYVAYGVPSDVMLLPDAGIDGACRQIAVEFFQDSPNDWHLCIRLKWIARYEACAVVVEHPHHGARDDVYWGVWHLDSTATRRVKLGVGADDSRFELAASILSERADALDVVPETASALAEALRAAVPTHVAAVVGVVGFYDPLKPSLLWFGACSQTLHKVELTGATLDAAIRCATLASVGSRVRNVYVLVLGSGDELKWRITYDGEAALRLMHVTERARVRAVEAERVRLRASIRKRRGRS